MSQAIFEIKNLISAYKTFAVRDVSFSLKSGDILGFVGRNGAGKSTTINTILGLKSKSSGDIIYNGENIDHTNIDQFRQVVGYVGDNNQYYLDATIKKVIAMLSKMYFEWDQKIFDYYCKEVFQIDTNFKIKELSSGNRVRINIAIALSHNASLLILDEPTSGIDPIVRNEILAILKNFASKENHAVLFSTHITEDIEKIATRVLCIVDGKIKLDVERSKIGDRFVRVPKILNDSENGCYNGEYMIVDRCENNQLDSLIEYEKASIDDVILYYEGGDMYEKINI